MNLVLAGLSHKTAPVEARERFTIAKDRLAAALKALQATPGIEESLILSTCNRVEFALIGSQGHNAVDGFREFAKSFYGTAYDEFSHLFYVHQGYEAVRHLFRVAAGLDSLVVGEPQILGQMKSAYQEAKACGAAGNVLDLVCPKVFNVAKRIRSETRISEAGASVITAAVEMAEGFLGTLKGKSTLIVGAGEMGKHAALRLTVKGASTLLVSNRTHARAVELAQELKGLAVRFDAIWEAMGRVDVILSSTGCPHFLITREDMEALMEKRGGRRICLIDIAVPRDIDPRVREVRGCQLINLDDLEQRAEKNTVKRTHEAEAAYRIIDEELARFRQRQEALATVPTIVSLREYAEAIRRFELARTRRLFGHLTREQQEALEILTQGLVNKLLHTPFTELKQAAVRPDRSAFLDVVRTIFHLDPKSPPESTN